MARPYSIISDIKNKIKTLQLQKSEQLETIAVKRQDAQREAEQAAADKKAAADRMDLKSYEDVKAREARSRTAAEMYAAKYEQIRNQEYISDADSEKVISDLIEHEQMLEREFKKAIAEHNAELSRLHSQYRQAVQDAENVISDWTENIHANYISENTTYAGGSHRSPQPVPVHAVPYAGCAEADILRQYLMKAYME